MTALALAFAALIGVLLGLLGGGGSILTVPVFVYLLGFTPKAAIAMSLPVVGATSLVGALGHWRAGNVRLRTALTFGACAMLGSFVGARLARHMTGQAQLVLLAIVMLGAAVTMFRARPAEEDELPRAADALALGGGALALVLWVGLAVGVLTGLVGVGGGFLIVPALVVLGRIPIKQSVGTSLLVIAMNAASGFAGYLGTVDVEWRFVALFTGVAMVGILVGTRLVRHVSAAELKRAFAAFLVLMATLIIVQNRAVLLGRDPGAPDALRAEPAPRR
jgi:uncharacterized protein